MIAKNAIEETSLNGHGFLFTVFHCPQERRSSETSYQPKWPEQVCEYGALEDRGHPHPERPAKSKRLNGTSKEKTFQFRHLPFGLAGTPWAFTKALKPLAA